MKTTELSNYVPASDLSGLKVGDPIFNLRIGWGIVKDIQHEEAYPIYATFDEGRTTFTLNGKMYEKDKYPSAWPFNPFEQQKQFKPYWAMVWDYNKEEAQRYLVIYEINGEFIVDCSTSEEKEYVSYHNAERIPNTTQLTIEQAEAKLKEFGFEAKIVTE